MLKFVKIGDVDVFLSANLRSPTKNFIHNCEFAVILNEFDKRTRKEKIVLTTNSPISYYFDDDFALFISDIDGYPNLLLTPISAVLFKPEKVEIFFKETIFVCEPDQVKIECRQPSFFSSKLGPEKVGNQRRKFTNLSLNEPSSKKTRTIESPECSQLVTSIRSDSIMLETVISQSNNISEQVYNEVDGSVEDDEKSSDEDDESMTNQDPLTMTRKFVRSRIDEKMAHRDEVKDCLFHLSNLLSECDDSHPEQFVPVANIEGVETFDKTDEVVKSMLLALEQREFLPDPDPVVVIARGNDFKVLSGNRRVCAMKIKGFQQMRAKVIQPHESERFQLRQFLKSCKTPADNEINTLTIIRMLRSLLAYLNLTQENFHRWTDKEINTVFGTIFKERTKTSLILKMFKNDVLISLVEKLTQYMTTGYHLLHLIHSKYKTNPICTRLTLYNCSIYRKDGELRKELIKVPIDVTTILTKKGVCNTVIENMINKYSSDDQFVKFARLVDLRKRSVTFESVERMFVDFKSKKKDNTRSEFVGLPTVEVLENPSDSNALITTKETVAREFINAKTTGFVMLIGSLIESESSCHSVLIPDGICSLDEHEGLENIFSISLFYRLNGEIVRGKDLTSWMRQLGVTRKQILQLEDCRVLLGNWSTVHLGVSCDHLEDPYIVHLVTKLSHVSVPEEDVKISVLRRLKNLPTVTE